MNLKNIKKTILSKNLIIFYCIFISQTYEMEFYQQIQAYWLIKNKGEKGDFKKFSLFLVNQLLNQKRSVIISVKFNNIFYECLTNGWLFEDFLSFCKKNKIFSTILRIKTKTNLSLQKEIILLILGLNLIFYKLIPFSILFIKKLKKKKYIAFNNLINYISGTDILKELQTDLKNLKNKQNLMKYGKKITLDKLFVLQLIKKCNINNLFNKTERINNKKIC